MARPLRDRTCNSHEEQQARLAHQQLGERHTYLPAARECFGRLVALGAREAQASQDCGDFRFHAIAAQALEPHVQSALTIDQLLQAIIVASSRRIGDCRERVQLDVSLLQLWKTRQ